MTEQRLLILAIDNDYGALAPADASLFYVTPSVDLQLIILNLGKFDLPKVDQLNRTINVPGGHQTSSAAENENNECARHNNRDRAWKPLGLLANMEKRAVD